VPEIELRSPKGTDDVLAPESARWELAMSRFAGLVARAGYGQILTPLFEDLAVFQRVGEATDVVRKEMYDFEDKGGRRIALRPEITASVVRAFIQHHPAVPFKAWYAGPSFRYEEPQAGRRRQFYQLGIEAIGTEDADLDVEVIALGWEYYRALGLSRVGLLLNSLGDYVCRPGYRQLLIDYLLPRRGQLCDEHRVRLEENPLRVLDCKKPECIAATAEAPRQLDHLCGPCTEHFARVTEGLGSLGIPYQIETRLVRGLDYYTRTTFEYIGLALESAQNALGGGGRYDGLVEAMGGAPTPGIGFALGIERILLACSAEGVLGAGEAGPRVEVFVVDLTGGRQARDLTTELRAAGIRVDRAFDQRSAKAQFKVADRSGAALAVVVGPDELEAGIVRLQDLRAKTPPASVGRGQAVTEVLRRLDRQAPAGSPGAAAADPAGLAVTPGA
jgi:histidyl-tRNA synthetase